MPYITDSKALESPFLDRRVKLLPCQKEQLLSFYNTGLYSQRALAKIFKVSRRLVHFTVIPGSLEVYKAKRAPDYWRKYYKGGEEWNAVQREHRRYKHNTLTQKTNL